MDKQKKDQNSAGRNRLISTIWSIGTKIGMDSEEIHAVVYKQVGKDSIKKCTDRQLEMVISALKYIGNMQDAQRGKTTMKQRKYIEDLEYRLGWSTSPERMRGFLKKQYGVEHVEWLSVKQASDLIEALKGMLHQKMIKEGEQHG